MRLDVRKARGRERVRRVPVRDEADEVSAPGLFSGEIQHVPEKAADRRTHDVKDAERRARGGGGGVGQGRVPLRRSAR